METDGTITVLAKPEYLFATQKDVFNIQASRGSAQAFIIDGQLLPNSLKMLGKDLAWVQQILQENSIPSIKEVFFAQIDQVGNIYIDKRMDQNTQLKYD